MKYLQLSPAGVREYFTSNCDKSSAIAFHSFYTNLGELELTGLLQYTRTDITL